MDDIERIGSIKYEEFFRSYLEANQLCIFSSELTKHWRSRNEWVSNGRPNLEFLSKTFGHAVAPVANCCQAKYSSQVKQDMTVKEFCDYWNKKSGGDEKCTETLYLKDWHFCKAFPSYKAYETPIYFKSDWLNEFWDQHSDVADDYRFVYMGPKGSWTPFHADVFRSYSWSANICGCKKWLIYPPGQEKYLTDRLGNLAYDITSDDMNDKQQFPELAKASKPITVIQREGEVIFVPSGWYHQVINLVSLFPARQDHVMVETNKKIWPVIYDGSQKEDTISINHNWVNACGVLKMWEHIQSELFKVKQSIEDCKDMEHWHQQCQVILRASCGIDYPEFIEFLDAVATRRIFTMSETGFDWNREGKDRKDQTSLKTTDFLSSVFQDWKNSVKGFEGQEQRTLKDYCRYDLIKIKECLINVKSDHSFRELQNQDLHLKLDELLNDIDKCLKKTERLRH